MRVRLRTIYESVPRRLVSGVLVAGVLGAACAGGERGDGADSGRMRVVTSFYPLEEAARRIGGDGAVVVNLTPPGAEPHDLELTPEDLGEIGAADVVIYLGEGFQPSVDDGVAGATGLTVDALDGLELLGVPENGDGHGEDEGTAFDPHVWLDPGRYAAMVETIASAFGEVDEAGAETYRANAARFGADLAELDSDFAEGLTGCQRDTIVTSHAAYGYLADAYGLEQESISGLSPESEPDAQRLAELAALVEEQGVTTIFTEELVSPDVAETLASEAGVETAVLFTLEGLTSEQVENGDDFDSVMRTNLETLRAALDCR